MTNPHAYIYSLFGLRKDPDDFKREYPTATLLLSEQGGAVGSHWRSCPEAGASDSEESNPFHTDC